MSDDRNWVDRGYRCEAADWMHEGKGHDRTLIEGAFAGVADGATPLGPDWSDPGLLAEAALTQLSRFATQPPDGMAAVFAAAIKATSSMPRSEKYPPTCAVAVAWLDSTHVNVGVLGDCLALIEMQDGTLTVLTDPAVGKLDELALKTPAEHRLPLLRRHRGLANTVDGYWIYGDDPEAAEHVVSARNPLTEVRSVFLCTDGLKRVAAMGDAFESRELRAPGANDLDDVIDSVRSRTFAGRPVDDTDDEAAVLIRRA
jgi:hypothetical protein